MIDKIQKYFIKESLEYENKSSYNYWDNHVKYVVDIAEHLASRVNADREIVVISAILHDIAKVLEKNIDKPHNLVGADIAEELLLKEGYDKEKIEKVKLCIIHHSGSLDMEISKEEWCVRNADIISMFNNITIFYYLAINEYKLNYNETRKWVKDMISSKYKNLDENLKKEYDNLFDIIYNAI